MGSVKISVPADFRFEYCLQFLQRSPKEVLHRIEGNAVTKLLRMGNEKILVTIERWEGGLVLDFGDQHPSKDTVELVVEYVREWFDLDTNLDPFYKIARKDNLLRAVVRKYRGHRIMSHPDLFESLVWAVLGQQINLAFAYTLKQRFVETFGERVEFGNKIFFLFPEAARVAVLTEPDLLPLQFSRQKARYTINIARAFVTGDISKEKLRGLPLEEAKEILMKIKGIGNWTANYALMRSYRYPNAFPLEDAGLHNAIRNLLGMKQKPNLKKVKSIFRKYKGFEAYATVYFWKTL